MRVVNKFVKFWIYVGIHSAVALFCYLLSFFVSSIPAVIAFFFCSVFAGGISDLVGNNFWWEYLILCIPLFALFMFLVEADVIDLQTNYKSKRRQHKEHKNGTK